MCEIVSGLQNFLNEAHSTYHAVAKLAERLVENGYTCLSQGEPWQLRPGGKYYMICGGSALISFRIPKGESAGFVISASHSDRCSFKLKENGEVGGKYTRLSVERYGGSILSTWLDRPLSVAGRVLVETETGAKLRLLDIDRDLLLIPNVAIHMDRSVNDGKKWNVATDMLPLLGGAEQQGKLNDLLTEAAGGKILGSDLYLYVRQKASVWGVAEEFISAPVLDDLAAAWCCTEGYLAAGESNAIPVLCVFDNEEVGSGSAQGAGSRMLAQVLTRICRALGTEEEKQLSRSFLLSVDNAHAVHPNHPEYADPNNAPVLNGGIVLKYNAGLSYMTDAVSAGIVKKICKNAGVPVQTYYNRADLPGGATLARISVSQVSIPSADIGLAQLAMHSCYETAGVQDIRYLVSAMKGFYDSGIAYEKDGSFSIV